MLAARKPSLHGALLAAKAAGHTHVIAGRHADPHRPDRHPGPDPRGGPVVVGKHRHHGGNIQVVSAPDGWPLWTSPVRPGREHDTTAARADPELLTQIAAWVDDGQLGLADLGYEGEAETLRIPIKKTAGARPDLRPAGLQRRPRRPALPRRTRQQPAQDHLQGAAPLARLPLAHRRHRRRRAGPAPPRTPPNHLIHQRSQSVITTLLGKAHCEVSHRYSVPARECSTRWLGTPEFLLSCGDYR